MKGTYWIVSLLLFGLAACAPAATGDRPADGLQSDGGPGPVQVSPPESASPTPASNATEVEQYRIVTLLPRDAIPAIDDPFFISAAEAAEEYRPDELVIGVSFEGDTRAYSVELLSSHEIVNDTVGGRKIAVTW